MSLAEETAVVSFIKGEYAYLKADSVSACSSCSAKSSCGANTITKPDSVYNLRVKNSLNLKQGDSVVLGIESNVLMLGTFVMYILPLILLFFFSYIGKLVAGELFSIIGGIVGLFSGLFIVRHIVLKNRIAKKFEPRMICSDNLNN